MTTVDAPFRHRQTTVLATVQPPSRPTDLTTVFDRRSVGLLWRSEIIGTVGAMREVGAKLNLKISCRSFFLARFTITPIYLWHA